MVEIKRQEKTQRLPLDWFRKYGESWVEYEWPSLGIVQSADRDSYVERKLAQNIAEALLRDGIIKINRSQQGDGCVLITAELIAYTQDAKSLTRPPTAVQGGSTNPDAMSKGEGRRGSETRPRPTDYKASIEERERVLGYLGGIGGASQRRAADILNCGCERCKQRNQDFQATAA